MILFFEGKDYKRSLLDSVFGNEHARVISRGNLKDDKAVLDCVGYYYDSTQSHVFILPKVFNIGGKGFGCGWIVIVIVVLMLIFFIADGTSWDAIDTLLGLGLLAFLFFRWIST